MTFETLIYQHYLKSKNLNNINYQYIANSKDKLDFFKRFFFINAIEHSSIIDLDLAINIIFCEMDKVSVDNYFKYISDNLRKTEKFFIAILLDYQEKVTKNHLELLIGDIFKIDDIEVLYPSHRSNSKYLAVSCSKNF